MKDTLILQRVVKFPDLILNHVISILSAWCEHKIRIFSNKIIPFSLISHKEFRFLLPIFPLIMPYSGYGFMKLCTKLKDKRKYSSSFLTLLAGLNIIFALYFCTIHQRGVIDVMFFISGLVETGKNPSVLFLMPCHSTPFYRYMSSHCFSVVYF